MEDSGRCERCQDEIPETSAAVPYNGGRFHPGCWMKKLFSAGHSDLMQESAAVATMRQSREDVAKVSVARHPWR